MIHLNSSGFAYDIGRQHGASCPAAVRLAYEAWGIGVPPVTTISLFPIRRKISASSSGSSSYTTSSPRDCRRSMSASPNVTAPTTVIFFLCDEALTVALMLLPPYSHFNLTHLPCWLES